MEKRKKVREVMGGKKTLLYGTVALLGLLTARKHSEKRPGKRRSGILPIGTKKT